MKVIELFNRKFAVELKWYIFDDEQEVKEKIKELKKEKKKWKIFKKDDLIFLAVSDQNMEKTDPLAYLMIDKEPGFYTVKFDDNNCWIFVKGTDGGILFDEYGVCDEILRQNESELYEYEATLGTFKLTKEQLEQELSEKITKIEEEKGKKKSLVIIGVSAVVIIFSLLMIKQMIDKKRQEDLAKQTALQQQQIKKPQNNIPQQISKTIGKIDIKNCYNTWFIQTMYYSNSTQTCNTINQQNITPENVTSLTLPDCVNTAKYLWKMATYSGLTLSWGSVEPFGKARILNFKISGVIYEPMAEKFKDYLFVLPVQATLQGDPSNPIFTLQGGLLCK
ncbi:MAG: hypothetical protein ACPL1B_06860 [Thermoprotei archaeon]